MSRRLHRALGVLILTAIGLVSAQGIVLEDSVGTTVLDAPATRVVALEWTYAEDLVAVGVQPIGVADIPGYRTWVSVEPGLDADVTDVGTRQEPSLEAIAALEPDLIVGVRFRHAPILEQLQAIAPTLLFDPYPGEGGPTQLEEMEATFRTIAAAVGQSTSANAVVDALHDTYGSASEALEAAGVAGKRILLVQAFSSQNVPQIRVFTDNAMAVGILEEIGLQNAWPGAYAQFGFDTVEVEGLAPVSDADAFLYVVQQSDDVFAGTLATNPLWRNLGFVAGERAYALGGDTWLFGGPLSAQLFARRVVDLLRE